MNALPALNIVFQLTAATVAIAGVVISVGTYRRSQRIRKAEWLKSLFEMFYIADTFKDVRRWIDFDQLPEKLTQDPDHSVEEKFTDFLNFFEFIASLRLERQLERREIDHLFAYYLDKIKKSEICTDYIHRYGFRHLENLINDRS